MGEVCAMSAPNGSEDLTDNYRELITDRLWQIVNERSSSELMDIWSKLRAEYGD